MQWKNGGIKPETFDFLGFAFICGKTRKGWFKVELKTSKKRFGEKINAIKAWLKKKRNSMKRDELWKSICIKFRGHINYYGVSDNGRMLQKFAYLIIRTFFKWINRRSQRRSFNWVRFLKFLKFNPLPRVRIKHPMY